MVEPLFTNTSDFESRMNETFVSIKGVPYLARTYHSDPSVLPQGIREEQINTERTKQPLSLSNPDKPTIVAYLEDLRANPELEFSVGAQTLGLINGANGVYLPSRIPRRQFMLGTPVSSLTLDSLSIYVDPAGSLFMEVSPIDQRTAKQIILSKGAFFMFERKYPSVRRAFETITRRNNTSKSMAISRKLIVGRILLSAMGKKTWFICHCDHGLLWTLEQGIHQTFQRYKPEDSSLLSSLMSLKSDLLINLVKTELEALINGNE